MSVRSSTTRPAPRHSRARLLDPPARAGARRAGLGADELAEDASRHLLQPPGSVARRAGRDLGARLRAVAPAARAGHGRLERHLARDAVGRLDEVDLDRRDEVGAARAAASGAAAEQHVVAEEGREEVGEVAEVDVARPRSRRCAGPRGRSGRRGRASPSSTAPRTPRPPRGTAPGRPARRTRRDGARAPAGGRRA